MPNAIYPSGAAAILLVLLAGCASLGGNHAGSAQTGADPATPAQRQTLNEGYSLLYSSASSLSGTDKVFYVKLESDRVQRVIGNVSDYAAALQKKLERIDKDYPAVDIHLDPLPEIVKRKRAAISLDTKKELAPLVGKSGHAFERKLLLAASGALNQLRFQCQVMAAMEPVASLKTVLTNAQGHFSDLYDSVVKLLNEEYFVHNTYEPEKG